MQYYSVKLQRIGRRNCEWTSERSEFTLQPSQLPWAWVHRLTLMPNRWWGWHKILNHMLIPAYTEIVYMQEKLNPLVIAYDPKLLKKKHAGV